MRSPRLALVLAALNVGLLLVAVAGVASVAVLLLRGLADEQARARVEHSAASARSAVQRAGEEVLTGAHVLAGRPTLARLFREDREALPGYLDRFQRDSRLDGTAVMADGKLVASTGPRAEWSGGPGALFRWMEDGTLGLFAWADSPLRPDVRVGVLLRLDAGAVERISREVGAPLAVRRQAPAAGASTSAVPLRNPGGEIAGFVEASLPPGEIDRSVQRVVAILIGLAAALGIIGALASALLGARLSRPLAALSEAAGRIGHGDLATPVPSVGGAEIGALAESLEEMRRSLLRLTADLRRQQAESDAIVTGIV